MNKRWIVFLSLFYVGTVWAGAVPSQITYQGTLKQLGAAANGTYSMIFRITDSTGLHQYWSSGPTSVEVKQGLFSAVLSPSGVDWQSVAPYIEVNVSGQTLLPREPVNATPYALMCGSVADGSVFSGMIAIFSGSCPYGWSPFAPLQGRFPVGEDPSNPGQFHVGVTGGQITHDHAIALAGAHNHGGYTTGPNALEESDAGHHFGSPAGNHIHGIEMDGAHDHGGHTGLTNSLPPYLAVVYCQKQ